MTETNVNPPTDCRPVGFWGTVKYVVSPLASKDYWVNMLKDMVYQGMKSFLSALGGVLVRYGQDRLQTAINTTQTNAFGTTVPVANPNPFATTPAPNPFATRTYPVASPSDKTAFGFSSP